MPDDLAMLARAFDLYLKAPPGNVRAYREGMIDRLEEMIRLGREYPLPDDDVDSAATPLE